MDIPVLQIVSTLLRDARNLLTSAVLGAVLGVAVAFLLPQRFHAESRLMLQSGGRSSLPGNLAGLAGQFGVSLDALGSVSSTPASFFVELFQSRESIEALLRTPLKDGRGGTASLLDQLDVKGESERLRLERGSKLIRKRLAVESSSKSGIITVQLDLPRADLAADAVNSLVGIVNQFNTERLQFQSRQQRVFAEARAQEAARALRAAELEQLRFLERNRAYQQSPLLSNEAARLSREISARQDLAVTLRRALEEARIAEARDIPSLTTVDAAVPAARRSWPVRWLVVLVAVTGGVLARMAYLYGRAWYAHARRAERFLFDERSSADTARANAP